MRKAQENNKNIYRKESEGEIRRSGIRQYIFLAGKIFDIAEIGGKIHVYL